MTESSSSVQILKPTSAFKVKNYSLVGISQNSTFNDNIDNYNDDYHSNNEDNIDQKQKNNKGVSTITPFFDTSDSETEFIDHSDLGQGYETEPEDEAKNLEARETLQHEKLIKSGYLVKKRERRKVRGKNWKKRWFVLRSAKLAYYKSEKEYELLRILDMHDVHAVAEVNLKNKQNVFGIVTPKRTYYVQAESKKMLEEWIEAINKIKKEVQDEELLNEGSQEYSEKASKNLKRTSSSSKREMKNIKIQIPSLQSPVLDKPFALSPVKETVAIDIPNSQKKQQQQQQQMFDNIEGPHSYVSASSYTSGGSIPNESSSPPSSPIATNFSSGRKNSSDRTVTSEEENDMMDTTNDENDENNEGGEVSRIIHQGYVYKLDRYKKIWKKRWFELKNNKLVYYKDKKDRKPHLGINLIDILDAIEIEPISKSKLHCFKVITPRRTYVCCAPNDETQVAWLAAIQVALSKIKEKNKDIPTEQNMN